MRRAHASTALVLLLAACRGCSCGEASPPDDHSISRLGDPYPALPERGSVADVDRALAAVDAVADDLGYGAAPAQVMRANRNSAWVQRLVLFLAHGGTRQLRAAHRDLVDTAIGAARVPDDVKFKLKLSEVRMDDLLVQNPDEEKLRRAALAETVWCLYAMRDLGRDTGS